ncbi:MAG: hypothetical protein ACREVZ_00050 [Burkholderiales bacterium]
MPKLRAIIVALSVVLYTDWAQATTAENQTFVYPQERMYGVHKAILYAPQIESWPDFANFESVMAFEFYPDAGARKILATVEFSGRTEVDLAERLVYVTDLAIKDLKFAGRNTEAYEAAYRDGVRKDRLEVPLDLFLLSLDDSILDRPPPPGFSREPPEILVSTTPAIVLFINGGPVLARLPDTDLNLVVNANWPLVTDAKSSVYYLLDREVWLTARQLTGPWKATRKLPDGLSRLAKDGEHSMIAAAVPAPETKQSASSVHVRDLPTELMVIQGEPKLEEIPGTSGLSYVTNTDSPLFMLGNTWYFLAAGRWFSTADPLKGPWKFVETLPEAFAAIPDDHKVAYVRSAVRGTLEAKIAALESLLPKRKAVTTDTRPAIEVSYAGEPQFVRIEDTVVSRAVNTGYDVLLFGSTYYLCYAGIWYNGVTPTGPWKIATNLPPEIYAIPPSSPSYHLTQVTVVETTETTVVYEQTPAYSSSVYVVYGVPWYGTGYYYYPYAYGYYYYPYRVAYGHGSYYNPVTGGYGSRSVWYGPYGGYSYTNGYNPRTGRYGYVETAWDGNEWASHGETYNPRTGVATETGRYYNEGSNTGQMERTVERGDEWIKTERETDFDTGQSTTSRETSRGGSSTTTRDGTQSRTDFETGSGGQGTSVSNDGNRTTLTKSAEGDLYAGHNGNVYKKTGDGWQSYDPDSDGWNDVQKPERQNTSASLYGPADFSKQPSSASRSTDFGQLQRDAAARQSGMSSFERNRAGGYSGRRSMGGGSRPTRR